MRIVTGTLILGLAVAAFGLSPGWLMRFEFPPVMALQQSPPGKTPPAGSDAKAKNRQRKNLQKNRSSLLGEEAAQQEEQERARQKREEQEREQQKREEQEKEQQEREKQDKRKEQGTDQFIYLLVAVWAASLLMLLGLIAWLYQRLTRLAESYELLKRETDARLHKMDASLDGFQEVVDAHERDLGQLRDYSHRLKADLKDLRAERLHDLQSATPRTPSAAPRERAYVSEPYIAPPAPPKLWPATVNACLNRIGSDGVSAKRSYRGDLLQETATGDEDSLYVLARDPQQRSLWLVIPNLTRFNSSQDYNHYLSFYDCERPAAGDVWVEQPALAIYEEASAHWRLQQKGRLRVS